MKNLLFPELIGEMAKRGENQTTLAELLGITPGSINNKMAGRTQWTISEMALISNHYNRSTEELFKRNENY